MFVTYHYQSETLSSVLNNFKCLICVHWAYQKTSCSSHYGDVIIGAKASLITSLTIVYSTVYSGADQRKHQSSASLAFVRGIHRWSVNSPHKWPERGKGFHLMTSSCNHVTRPSLDRDSKHAILVESPNTTSPILLSVMNILCELPMFLSTKLWSLLTHWWFRWKPMSHYPPIYIENLFTRLWE